jgi:N-glycosylase/DNA lyase
VLARNNRHLVSFRWGDEFDPGTAGYWIRRLEWVPPPRIERQASLVEDVTFCLLGGYRIPYELNQAAYSRLLDLNLVGSRCAERLEDVLSTPFSRPGTGRTMRYPFPRQRAHRLVDAASQMQQLVRARHEPAGLRSALQQIRGIGPKTSAWIVRNHCGADSVGIIDVHISRVGLWAGFFHESWTPRKDYATLEACFLAVARLGGVAAGALDHRMWIDARRYRDVYEEAWQRRQICESESILSNT